MKQFFCDEKGQLSMGRLLTFCLFIVAIGMWIFGVATELTANNTDIIQWALVTSIGGKAVQKFGEKK